MVWNDGVPWNVVWFGISVRDGQVFDVELCNVKLMWWNDVMRCEMQWQCVIHSTYTTTDQQYYVAVVWNKMRCRICDTRCHAMSDEV